MRRAAVVLGLTAALVVVAAIAADLNGKHAVYVREATGEISAAERGELVDRHQADVYRVWGVAWRLAVLAVLCEIAARIPAADARNALRSGD